ncbi:hypothetical protein [Pontibacter rugosus]|uniref:STAS/SEC14 domain-containing protein n=1 Tax=Pontibacter rugosus TaxID=1745966 RepID=A0ABW3SNQ4_9BACT
MLLHNDGLIELNYDVASDILFVKWPDLTNVSEHEITYSFQKLIDTLRHYDIKNLLIDTRTNDIVVTEQEYEAMMLQLSRDLLSTRLQRVARLQVLNPDREKRVVAAIEKISGYLHISVQYKSFTSEAEAFAWLKEA